MTVVSSWRVLAWLGVAALCGLMAMPIPASAAAESEEGVAAQQSFTVGDGLRVAGLAIGAGIAVGIAGLGTARAQTAVGAGGTGAMAEKPELFTNILILFAIPETIVILGFVISILLWTKI